jgi:hypothetical protein
VTRTSRTGAQWTETFPLLKMSHIACDCVLLAFLNRTSQLAEYQSSFLVKIKGWKLIILKEILELSLVPEDSWDCIANWDIAILFHILSVQSRWVFGLYLSSGIPRSRKHKVSETGCVSVLRWREFLLFRIHDDGRSPVPSDSECYTPSSQPLRF